MAEAIDVNKIASRDVTVLRREGALRRESSGHQLFRGRQEKRLQRRLRGLLRVREASGGRHHWGQGERSEGKGPGYPWLQNKLPKAYWFKQHPLTGLWARSVGRTWLSNAWHHMAPTTLLGSVHLRVDVPGLQHCFFHVSATQEVGAENGGTRWPLPSRVPTHGLSACHVASGAEQRGSSIRFMIRYPVLKRSNLQLQNENVGLLVQKQNTGKCVIKSKKCMHIVNKNLLRG